MIKTTFSASRISELLAGGSGKTAQSYILDLALQSLGIKEDIQTPAMKHGLVNQLSAFENVILPLYPEASWFDEYISISEYCGASPDGLIGEYPLDIKCPYYIDSFIDEINQPSKKYFAQVQMQMMATGGDKGYLCYYLTKPEEWGQDEWNEYPFPLELRFKIFEYDSDLEMQDLILKKVEESQPKKEQMIKLLNEAEVMPEDQFFYEQLSGFKYRKLKECNNILNLEKAIRVGDKFYYSK